MTAVDEAQAGERGQSDVRELEAEVQGVDMALKMKKWEHAE